MKFKRLELKRLAKVQKNGGGRVELHGVNFMLGEGVTFHGGADIEVRCIIDDFSHIGANVFIGHGAVIGAGSIIGHGAHIGSGAELGKNVHIGSGAYICPGLRIPDGAWRPW